MVAQQPRLTVVHITLNWNVAPKFNSVNVIKLKKEMPCPICDHKEQSELKTRRHPSESRILNNNKKQSQPQPFIAD